MVGRRVKPRPGYYCSNQLTRCRGPVLWQWCTWTAGREEGRNEKICSKVELLGLEPAHRRWRWWKERSSKRTPVVLTWQTWQVIGSTFQKDSEEDTGGLTVGGREERESCMYTSWILFC